MRTFKLVLFVSLLAILIILAATNISVVQLPDTFFNFPCVRTTVDFAETLSQKGHNEEAALFLKNATLGKKLSDNELGELHFALARMLAADDEEEALVNARKSLRLLEAGHPMREKVIDFGLSMEKGKDDEYLVNFIEKIEPTLTGPETSRLYTDTAKRIQNPRLKTLFQLKGAVISGENPDEIPDSLPLINNNVLNKTILGFRVVNICIAAAILLLFGLISPVFLTKNRAPDPDAPFTLRITKHLPFCYIAYWFAVVQLLAATTSLIIFREEGTVEAYLYILFGSIGMLLCATCFSWSYKSFIDHKQTFVGLFAKPDTFETWLDERLRRTYTNPLSHAAGAACGVLFCLVVYSTGLYVGLTITAAAALHAFTFISAYFLGYILFSMLLFAIMIFHLKDQKFNSEKGTRRYQLIGRICFNYTLVGIAIYVSYLLAALLGLPDIPTAVIILICVMGFALIAFFVIPQVGIHEILETKNGNRINDLRDRIKERQRLFDASQDMKDYSILAALKQELNDEMKEPVWTFDVQMLLSVVLSTALPAIWTLYNFFQDITGYFTK